MQAAPEMSTAIQIATKLFAILSPNYFLIMQPKKGGSTARKKPPLLDSITPCS